jgi:membrane-associated phospholipid phosphatase
MVKAAANFISVVFHPLFLTTYLFAVLMYFFPAFFLPLRPSWGFLFLILLMTFILPAINFLIFRMSGSIKDFTLPHRSDRALPFAFIAILYTVVTLMFYLKFPNPTAVRLMLIASALVIASAIITLFYKISIHTLAVWGMVGMLLPLNKPAEGTLLYPTVVCLLVAGLVMWARLALQAHSPREVLVGALTGCSIGFAGIIILFA